MHQPPENTKSESSTSAMPSKFPFHTTVPDVTELQWIDLVSRLQKGELSKLFMVDRAAYYQRAWKTKNFDLRASASLPPVFDAGSPANHDFPGPVAQDDEAHLARERLEERLREAKARPSTRAGGVDEKDFRIISYLVLYIAAMAIGGLLALLYVLARPS